MALVDPGHQSQALGDCATRVERSLILVCRFSRALHAAAARRRGRRGWRAAVLKSWPMEKRARSDRRLRCSPVRCRAHVAGGSRVGWRIAALIDWWPCALSRYVDPEGFLKADRSDTLPCSVPPPCSSSKRAQPLSYDGICAARSGITLQAADTRCDQAKSLPFR
jgi:hypothetical protein